MVGTSVGARIVADGVGDGGENVLVFWTGVCEGVKRNIVGVGEAGRIVFRILGMVIPIRTNAIDTAKLTKATL